MGSAETLDVFGLSCGLIAGMGIVAILWHLVSIAVGAWTSGLESPAGRALLALLAAIALAIPVGLALVVLSPALGAKAQVFAGQVGSGAAELLAIKWVYKAPWARALLTYLVASVLTAAGLTLLLTMVF